MTKPIHIVEMMRDARPDRFGAWPCRGCGRALVSAGDALVACLRCGAEHLVKDVNATVEPCRPGGATPVGRVVERLRALPDGVLMRAFMTGEWPAEL